MEKELLAYMAGIVDGEGCLTISKQIRKNRISPAYRSTITVTNTDNRIIEIFPKYFNGIIYERKDKRIEKKWADNLTWYCPDGKAVEFLTAIKPYLRSKHKQAEILLEFQAIKSNYKAKTFGQGLGSKPLTQDEIEIRESFHKQIRLLNSKGVFCRKTKLTNEKK